MSKTNWELTGNDPNDLIAKISETDTLRVERLGEGVWWFAIYIGDATYMSGECFPHVGSKQVAKDMCQQIYTLIKRLIKN